MAYMTAHGERALQGHALRVTMEMAWRRIAERHPELPAVHIALDDDRAPEFSHWDRDNDVLTLAREHWGADGALLSLLQAAVHVLAEVRGIQVTSSKGRFHNTRFRELAEEIGLTAEKDPERPERGVSVVNLTQQTRTDYAEELDNIRKALALAPPKIATHHAKTPAVSGQQIVWECKCAEPKRIRVFKLVSMRGGIRCDDCGQLFE